MSSATLQHGVPVLVDDGVSRRPVAPYLDRDEWKHERIGRIGSSDAATLFGLNEYSGPWDVWDRIVLGDWKDELEGGDIRRGNKQEPIAVETFTERTGLEVRSLPMVAHVDEPLLVTDIDGLIVPPDIWPEQIQNSEVWSAIMDCGGPGALEVKVPRVSIFYRYKEEGLPRSHIVQHQHHMMVTGLTWGFFAFYTPEYDDLVAFPVVRDDDFCDWLRRAELEWYETHVVGDERPTRIDGTPPRWPDPIPGEAEMRVDDEWMEWAELLAMRHYELLEVQEAYQQTEAKLLELFGEDDRHVAGGGVTVKRKESAQQRRTDWKAFRAAVKRAQEKGDTDALLALDPDADDFKYLTNSNERIEVTVRAPNPLEVIKT